MKVGGAISRMALALVLVVVMAGVSSGSKEEKGQAKTSVTFGTILPLSGEVANWGHDSSNGIELALDQANSRSSKYDFHVVYEDSKGQAAQAVAAAHKLININKVLAIIGDNVSGPTIAIVSIAAAAKVPVISPSASSPKLSGMSKFFFRVYPSDTAEGGFMAKIAASTLKLKKIAILYINNDFGVGLRDVFSQRFSALGGEITSALGYDVDETDFRPYLTRIKEQSPDGVYLAGYFKDAGAILRQAKELGLKVQFLGSTTDEDPQLIAIAGDAANGLVYPYSTGYDPNSANLKVVEFNTAFRKKFGRAPGVATALGYDSAELLIAAVEQKGPSNLAIRDFLSATKNYQGITGTMTFDEAGDVHKPILLKTVKDGKFVICNPDHNQGR